MPVKKSCEPGFAPGVCAGDGESRTVFATASLPIFGAGAFDVPLSSAGYTRIPSITLDGRTPVSFCSKPW